MKPFYNVFTISIVSVCLVVVATSCTTVPYTGRNQMMLVSESYERELGQRAWNEVKKKERESQDLRYKQALSRVGNNLAKAINAKSFDWEFMVFESKVPNAFCLPGGKVAVYTGLFKFASNDAELATVVGHEIAHAVARHGGERMSQQMAAQIGAELIKAGTEGDKQILQIYGAASNVGALLPYSRTHEYEADVLGLMYMAQAGYEPEAALSFWKKFSVLSDINFVEELLSTHPAGENRIEELSQKMPEAKEFYKNAKVKHGLGQIYDKDMMNPVFPQAPADKEFSDAELGYSFKYPGDWQVEKGKSAVTVVSADGVGRVYVQNVNKSSKYTSIDTLYDDLKVKLPQKVKDGKVSGRKDIFVKDRRAVEFFFDYTFNDTSYRQWIVIYARKDNSLFYVFSFYTPADKFKDYIKSAQEILKSMKPELSSKNKSDALVSSLSKSDAPAAAEKNGKNATAKVPLTEDAEEIHTRINNQINNEISNFRSTMLKIDTLAYSEGLKNNMQHKKCKWCKGPTGYVNGQLRWACKRCGKTQAYLHSRKMANGKTLKEELDYIRKKTVNNIKQLRKEGNKELALLNHPPMWNVSAPVALLKRNVPKVGTVSKSLKAPSQPNQGAVKAPRNTAARIIYERINRSIRNASYNGNNDFKVNMAARARGQKMYGGVKCPKCGGKTEYDYGNYRWHSRSCNATIGDLIDTPYKGTTIQKYLIRKEDKARRQILKLRKQGNTQLRRLNHPPLWVETAPVTSVSDHRNRVMPGKNIKAK